MIYMLDTNICIYAMKNKPTESKKIPIILEGVFRMIEILTSKGTQNMERKSLIRPSFYMLDTNICIYAMKNKPEKVLRRLREELDNGVCISSITLGSNSRTLFVTRIIFSALA